MKRCRAIISFFSIIFILVALSAYADSFEQHVVSVYSGPSAKPDFQSLPGSKMFRTRIRDGIKQGVNFAGHYAIVTFGCGTDCSFSFLVDVRSGKIFDFPLGGDKNFDLSLDYRADSKLIKASWIEGDDPIDNPICVRQEFVLKGTTFKPLRQTRTKGKCEPEHREKFYTRPRILIKE